MKKELDFRKVCEHNYDPIHITDGEGNILFINEAYSRVTGITPDIYLGRNIFDVEREGVLYKGSVSEQVIRTGQQVNNIAHIHGKDIDVPTNENDKDMNNMELSPIQPSIKTSIFLSFKSLKQNLLRFIFIIL